MPSSFSSSSPPLPSLTSSFLTCFSTDTQQCCFQCQPPSGSYKIASRSCAAGAARSAAAAAAAGAGSRLRHSEAARAPACRCSLRPPSLMIARAHVQSRAHKHAKAHMHAHLLLCSRDCMQHGALASWSYCKSAKKLAGQSWMACDGRSTACSMLELHTSPSSRAWPSVRACHAAPVRPGLLILLCLSRLLRGRRRRRCCCCCCQPGFLRRPRLPGRKR